MTTNGEGGCGSKVDVEKLVRLLRGAGLSMTSPAEFVDAHILDLPGAETGLAMSVDLIYDPGLQSLDFGWIGAVHALSDIYASLAEPIAATICLGATNTQIDSGASADVLRGAVMALGAANVELAGGHTVYAERPFIATSPVGVHYVNNVSGVKSGTTYELWISKPIGTGIRLAAHRQEIQTFAENDIAIQLMKATNATAATTIKVVQSESGDVAFVTDVSGFGLLTAISSFVQQGWVATLDSLSVPTLDDVRALVVEQAIFTNLGEKNMFWARGADECDVSGVAISELLVLCDPQTSGGLLAAIGTGSSDRLVKDSNSEWTKIGILEEARGVRGDPLRLRVI